MDDDRRETALPHVHESNYVEGWDQRESGGRDGGGSGFRVIGDGSGNQ